MTRQRWTGPDATYWYKVIAHTQSAHLFNIWHCATAEQAMSTAARWTPSAPPLLPLRFEIRKMRDWLHIETLPYDEMGD